MFEHVAGVGVGVDDDEVGLQLGDALGQEHIGRQRGEQVVARFEQADLQRLGPPRLTASTVVLLAGRGRVVATTMRRGGDFMLQMMQEACRGDWHCVAIVPGSEPRISCKTGTGSECQSPP